MSIKKVEILTISDPGWRDTETLLADEKRSADAGADQWTVPWTQSNALGFSALVSCFAESGEKFSFLLDSAWNPEHMRERLSALELNDCVKSTETGTLVFTHEDNDHFWGLEAVLELNPRIRIVMPETFSAKALAFISGKSFPECGAVNRFSHNGELLKIVLGSSFELAQDIFLAAFDVSIHGGTRGEISVFIKVKDKGILILSGCCHHGVQALLDFASLKFPGVPLYGIYGGLHLSPFGFVDERGSKGIDAICGAGFKKIACLHCTGDAAIEEMRRRGLKLCDSADAGNDCRPENKKDLVPF